MFFSLFPPLKYEFHLFCLFYQKIICKTRFKCLINQHLREKPFFVARNSFLCIRDVILRVMLTRNPYVSSFLFQSLAKAINKSAMPICRLADFQHKII